MNTKISFQNLIPSLCHVSDSWENLEYPFSKGECAMCLLFKQSRINYFFLMKTSVLMQNNPARSSKKQLSLLNTSASTTSTKLVQILISVERKSWNMLRGTPLRPKTSRVVSVSPSEGRRAVLLCHCLTP